MISDAYLCNSAELTERLKLVNFTSKRMARFDVKALFTNIPVEGVMDGVRKALTNISESDLPIECSIH